MRKLSKYLAVVGLSAVVVSTITAHARAAEFIGPDHDSASSSVVISASEKHRNLYAAGRTVVVNGEIAGDLYAVGATVEVHNKVKDDVTAAGATVTLNGAVGGDVRAAGATVSINRVVGGDVLAAGSVVRISDKSIIGGDLVAGGSVITVDGPVLGAVKLEGETIVINSKIGGNVIINEGRSDQKITFGPNAELSGELVIYGDKRTVVKEEGARVPDARYEAARYDRGGMAAAIGGIGIAALAVKLVAWIIVLMLAVTYAPRRSLAAAEQMLRRPWVHLGWGLLVLIGAPIAALLGFISVVGYYASFIVLAVYFLLLLLAAALSALFAGAWVVQKLTKKPAMVMDWQAAAVGALIMLILPLIPIVGWLVCFALFLGALGVLVEQVCRMCRSERIIK